MSPPLHLRQTPQPLVATLTQPTTNLALSTTFTPPASCLLPSQVNILPSPGYLIWHNEPVPLPGVTKSACYPSEFLRSYTSIAPTTSLALGSSVVPAMSPLVCPVGFCTQYVGDGNYLACCPSGYKFATTGTPIVKSRPAYGGVCYTDIPQGQDLTALVFDATGGSHQEVWAPSTTGAQGWAHPIDGWAASPPVVGCAVRTTTTTTTSSGFASRSASEVGASSAVQTSSSTVSSVKKGKKKASGGVIAGAVLGALVALAAILGLVLVLLRRKKQSEGVGEKAAQSDGLLNHVDGSQIHQKDGSDARVEVNAVAAAAELDSHGQANAHELGTGAGTNQAAELPVGDGRGPRA